MDESIVLFILLIIILAVILTAIVLPIVALVISIRTRSKLTKQLAALGSPSIAPTDNRDVRASLAQLQARVDELEAFVAKGRQQPRPIEPLPTAPIEQTRDVPSEPPPQQIPPAPPSISQSPPPIEPAPPIALAQGID